MGQDEANIEEYRERLNEAVLQFGNVHREDEKIDLSIDGLSENIWTTVVR